MNNTVKAGQSNPPQLKWTDTLSKPTITSAIPKYCWLKPQFMCQAAQSDY